jgi:hypothetical protein
MSNISQGQISAGKGWSDPGQWELGKYTVKLYLGKQLVAQKSFEIVSDESLPAELKLYGVYYRIAPNGETWFFKFFDDGRVMEILTHSASPSAFQTSLDRAWMCFNQYWEHGEGAGRISCSDVSMGVGLFKVTQSQLNFSTQGMFRRDNRWHIDFTDTASTASLNLSWTTIQKQSGIGTFTYLECPRNTRYRCVK